MKLTYTIVVGFDKLYGSDIEADYEFEVKPTVYDYAEFLGEDADELETKINNEEVDVSDIEDSADFREYMWEKYREEAESEARDYYD